MMTNTVNIDLLDEVYSVNTFCRNYDEANDSLGELKDILDEKGYISIADWHEWEDPDYFENRAWNDKLTEMQIGWTSIDSFSIKVGSGIKPRGMKNFYYILADAPKPLDNLTKVCDEMIHDITLDIVMLQHRIDELTAIKKGA